AVYKYVLPAKAKAWVYSWVAKPSLGSPGWESATFRGGSNPISVSEGGSGRSSGEAIDVSATN
ncbi:MAG: hypothetical protein QF391_16460, partial [Myxococcota bacterium]|nr:hypothetical protein [Myxococcota bacterium]